MTSSILNMVAFLLTTILYYFVLCPKLTIDEVNSKDKMGIYEKKKYNSLGIYIFIVITTQFLLNIYAVVNQCGGNIQDNIIESAIVTFFPWLLMFGVIVIVIISFPGFKSAFSDVVGYFYVSSSANNLLTELLIDQNVKEHLDDTNLSDSEKDKIAKTADTIIKICGNTSILLNRMIPENFNEFWNILNPLKKTKYQSVDQGDEKYVDPEQSLGIKTNLLDLVVSKDNVGEAFWFTYTGILICSIVQMQISTRKCYVSMKEMEKQFKDFQDQEDQAEQDKQDNPPQVYTVD